MSVPHARHSNDATLASRYTYAASCWSSSVRCSLMSFVRAMLMLCSRYSSPNRRCSANSRCSSCPFHHAIQCTPQSRSMDPRSIRYTPARGTAGSLRASKHSVHSLPSDPIVQWPPSTDQCLAALDRSRSQVARAPATRTIKTAHSVTQSFDRSPIDRSCQWRLYIHDSTLVRTAPLASWVPWPERRHHQQQHEHTLTRAHEHTQRRSRLTHQEAYPRVELRPLPVALASHDHKLAIVRVLRMNQR